MSSDGVVMVSPYRGADEPEIAFPGDSAMKWYTRRLAFALCKRNVPVTVLSVRRPHAGASAFRDNGVSVRAVLDARPLLFSLSLLREIQRLPQRIVHVQHELYAYASLLDALLLPLILGVLRFVCHKRVVCTMHGVFAPTSIDAKFASSNRIWVPLPLVRAAWWWITAGLCRVSERLQVHERGHVAVLVASYACRVENIVIIPIGVDEEKHPIEEHAEKTILFFGTISARKGITAFIAAIPDILQRLPQSRIIIAGDVARRLHGVLDIPRLCEEAGVDMARVSLRGFVPDVDIRELFASVDVLVLPYIMAVAASGPLSLALGHGVPVLASNVFSADFPDAPGLFHPNPSGIANVVMRFFSEETVRSDVKKYWMRIASQRTWDRVACDLKVAYDSLFATA